MQTILSGVNGGHPSIINGLLQVSGSSANLYLINPAGILFGPGAALNLQGSFTATTADQVGFGDRWLDVLNPSEYSALTGTPNQFAFTLEQPGAILNLGDLAVEAGQNLSLIGGEVVTLGTLNAPAGTITLMAVPGENRVRISQENMLLSLEIAPPLSPTGQLQLNPLSLPELLTGGATTANNLTVVQLPDGTVRLESATAAAPVELGSVIAAGTIAAAGDRGGQIYLLGEQIAVLDADINASGNAGGGSIRLGGDWQGQGELPTATTTRVDRTSQIRADSLTAGDGGSIIVWADDATRFLGAASVRGAGTGAGGFVEVSGLRSLQFSGSVDASAPSGNFGTLLLDPENIVVGLGGISDLSTVDALPGDVQVDVTAINNFLATFGQANVELRASNDITFDADISMQPPATFGSNGIRALAGNDIRLNSNITTLNGLVELRANEDGVGGGSVIAAPGTTIQTGGGNVTISGASLQLGTIDTSGILPGQVDLTASSNITFEAIAATATPPIGANVSINPGGTVNVIANGTVQGFSSGITISAQGSSPGTVTLQHDGGPNNVPFQIGNNGAAVNGTNGAIATTLIPTTGSFPVLPNGGDTNPPGNDNLTLTSLNTAPTLTAAPQLSTLANEPLSFTLADLNTAIADANNDNTTLAVAAIPSGTLLRNGVAVQVGDAIARTDTLQFIPPADVTGPVTAFTLQASDGVAASAPVAITITLTPPPSPPLPTPPSLPPLDPSLGTTQPPNLPQLLPGEATLLSGIPLAQSAVLEDLVVLGMVLPEPSWLIVGASFVNPEDLEPRSLPGGAIFPDLGFVAGGGTTILPSTAQPETPIPDPPTAPDVPAPITPTPDIPDPSEPSGGDTTAPAEPAEVTTPDPSTPDIAAVPAPTADATTAATRSAVSQGLQNCETAAEEIQTKASRDRTQPVYAALITCYEESLATAIAQADDAWVAYSLHNLATAFFVVGDYLKSLELYQQQLTQAIALNDPTQEGIALGGIGAAYAALGDYPTAIDYYERSLAVMPIETAPQWKALTFRNLGNAYFAEQDYGQAAAYQRASLDISRAIGDTYGEMQAQGNLGGTLAIQGDFDEAIAAYEQALTLATSLNNDLETAQTLLGLSTTYAYQQNYEQAYRYSRESLAIARQLGASLGEGIALTNLGNALLYLERLPEAEQALFEAIALWESLRAGLGTNDSFKVSLFETQLAAYRNLQEVLIVQNKVAPALEISERSRARAFVELLARGAANPNQIGSLSPPNISQIQQIARTRNATLVEYTIVRDQVAATPHAVSVQNPLEPRDAQLYIWVVQPNGTVQFRQVSLRDPLTPDSVEALVTETRIALTDRSSTAVVAASRGIGVVPADQTARSILPGDFVRREGDLSDVAPYEVVAVSPDGQTVTVIHPEFVLPNPMLPVDEVVRVEADGAIARYPLQQLHHLLIAPIADLLPTDPNASVIFVPQEHLFLVPFAALQDDQGQYLIERHTPLISPSIQTLALVQNRHQPPASTPTEALIVGNPSPMPGSYAPLPNAETEAVTIADLLATTALVREGATEAQVKERLATADLIHLATHGQFDETQPLQGAIALAPDAQNDGFLTAAEILDLSLQADLVILSACDTGRGRITGDGVIGLSRSFMAAGVPRVIVSLWQVPDEPTADLMVAFHQQRLQIGSNPQALRQAMLAMLETNPDPAVWAAFVQIGG